MRFLVDAQLPPSLVELWREHGHEAAHVFDTLPYNARDHVIWPFALTGGYVVVTKDEDFAEWSRLRQPAPPVGVAADRKREESRGAREARTAAA